MTRFRFLSLGGRYGLSLLFVALGWGVILLACSARAQVTVKPLAPGNANLNVRDDCKGGITPGATELFNHGVPVVEEITPGSPQEAPFRKALEWQYGTTTIHYGPGMADGHRDEDQLWTFAFGNPLHGEFEVTTYQAKDIEDGSFCIHKALFAGTYHPSPVDKDVGHVGFIQFYNRPFKPEDVPVDQPVVVDPYPKVNSVDETMNPFFFQGTPDKLDFDDGPQKPHPEREGFAGSFTGSLFLASYKIDEPTDTIIRSSIVLHDRIEWGFNAVCRENSYPPGPGGIPEPSAWAFGLVSATSILGRIAIRRRRKTTENSNRKEKYYE